jgi:mono/diheme cytochrome c family protein
MRADGTQRLTDGELYSIIENGIRLTGMPAWGATESIESENSWALVAFIRHLPKLGEDELQEMPRAAPPFRPQRERGQ